MRPSARNARQTAGPARRSTVADVALRLGHPLLIVAPDEGGATNHALLTIEAARRRGLDIAGVVLNHGPARPQPPAAGRLRSAAEALLGIRRSRLPRFEDACDAAAIERCSGVPVLGVLPYTRHMVTPLKLNLGAIAEASLDLDVLFRSS